MNRQNFIKVRFDDMCRIITERIDDPKKADTDYYVGLEHLDPEELKIQRHSNPKKLTSSKFKFKTGHILFGRRRAYQRKLAVADREGICSTDIFVLMDKHEKIYSGFLPIFMQSEEFYQKVLMLSAGSLSPRVKWKQIAKQKFWIPSKSIQKKIASILSNVDACIEATKNTINKAEQLKKSQMQQLFTHGIGHKKFKKVKWMFGKEIEIPEEWKIHKLENIVEILDSERIPLEGSDRNKRQGKYPYYGASGIIDSINSYIFNETLLCLAEDGENLRSRVLPIAFIIKGKTWVNNHAHVLRIKKNNSVYFLKYFLNHISILNYVASTAQPKLNQKDMRSILIINPSELEQQKIASILSEIDAQINQLKLHLKNLKIMRKSFINEKLTIPNEEK